jgi:hypothetical protein
MTLKWKIYENWSLDYQIKALNKSLNFVLITHFYVNYNLIYEVFSQLHVCEKLRYN